MKAVLKSIFSLEIDCDIAEYGPQDSNVFGISLRLMIGPEVEAGSESFDIFVCTPDWLSRNMNEMEALWGRHMLIVKRYDYQLFRQTIEGYISDCQGNNWLEIAQKLSRIGAWEFEDYRAPITKPLIG